MWKVRYYLPLVGFVLPTLIIGYGFVIPTSCIRGVNELSIGFGSTVIGAALTYFAGIRAATAGSCPVRPPWRVRLARYVNRQAAHPHGPFGWFLGVVWTFEHRKLNEATLDLLDVRSTDHVLDVGCGSGGGVRQAARRAPRGEVTGLDVSTRVLSQARRRNLALVRAGRVRLARVSSENWGLAAERFDRIFSVHSLYFWSDLGESLLRLAAALRPGGRLVLAFRPDGPDLPARFRDDIYRFYAPTKVQELALAAGFRTARLVSATEASKPVVWLVAERSG